MNVRSIKKENHYQHQKRKETSSREKSMLNIIYAVAHSSLNSLDIHN